MLVYPSIARLVNTGLAYHPEGTESNEAETVGAALVDRQRLFLAASLLLAAASVLGAGYVAWSVVAVQAPAAWWRFLFFPGFIGLPAVVLATLGRQWCAGKVLLTAGAPNPSSRRVVRGLLIIWTLLVLFSLVTPSVRLAAPFFCAFMALYLPQAWGQVQLRERGIATGSGLIPWKLVIGYDMPDTADAYPVASIYWKTARRDHTFHIAVAPEHITRLDEVLSAHAMNHNRVSPT